MGLKTECEQMKTKGVWTYGEIAQPRSHFVKERLMSHTAVLSSSDFSYQGAIGVVSGATLYIALIAKVPASTERPRGQATCVLSPAHDCAHRSVQIPDFRKGYARRFLPEICHPARDLEVDPTEDSGSGGIVIDYGKLLGGGNAELGGMYVGELRVIVEGRPADASTSEDDKAVKGSTRARAEGRNEEGVHPSGYQVVTDGPE
ncbi:hypothetical protein B0H14DRAFT_2624875 [Mycena olivaceomarginata]|nr:hypothetical protein B0H14DRAFT_2624875 [Mycena olivaceomarginata]